LALLLHAAAVSLRAHTRPGARSMPATCLPTPPHYRRMSSVSFFRASSWLSSCCHQVGQPVLGEPSLDCAGLALGADRLLELLPLLVVIRLRRDP
jgi:hypothetical protein